MARFRFIGDPERDGEGPDSMTWLGITFPRGEAIDVPDEAVSRLQGHSHFEQTDGESTGQPAQERTEAPQQPETGGENADEDWQGQYTDEQLAWLDRNPADMTKDELVDMGAAFGLELKKQANHDTLVEKIKAAVNGDQE